MTSCINSSRTLLIKVWSMFAGLTPPDLTRVHTMGQFSRIQKSLSPILKAFAYKFAYRHQTFSLWSLMPIRNQFLILCFIDPAKENWLNIENNSEESRDSYQCITPCTLISASTVHMVWKQQWRQLCIILLKEHSSTLDIWWIHIALIHLGHTYPLSELIL